MMALGGGGEVLTSKPLYVTFYKLIYLQYHMSSSGTSVHLKSREWVIHAEDILVAIL